MSNEITKDYKEYFSSLKEDFTQVYDIAKKARSKGKDPSLEPESKVAFDLAERTEKSVGPPDISKRIRELNKIMPREEVAFKIAEEIALGKYGHEGEKAAEQAIRTALSILDEGVTAAPIQGIVRVTQKRNPDGTKHLSIYFAGPIRSAGGTEMALTLVVADFVRQNLGLGRFKATAEEASRFSEEVRIYEREIARFQYKLSDEELINAVLNLPVEVTGVETDPIEVVSYKNLERIETNRVRGGALRVINDGLIGRSNKVLKIVDKLGIPGWDWLKKLKPQSPNNAEGRQYRFMEEVIAGRPIFSFPGRYGGFRLRYGRSRNTGLASVGIHPATMHVLDGFIATGTQIRIEKPGKAGIVVPVDTIEPPVVRLKNKTVLKIDSPETAIKKADEVEAILFIGDILIGFGEFLENNKPLDPIGYVEEWWIKHLEKAVEESFNSIDNAAHELGINYDRLQTIFNNPLKVMPTIEEAFKISESLKIPLHPKYTYFWDLITAHDLLYLRSLITEEPIQKNSPSIKLAFDPRIKEILEGLCLPHRLGGSTIVIEGDEAKTLIKCLNTPLKASLKLQDLPARKMIEHLSGIKIMDKAGTFIGTRMGRPEKAKERVMKPLVHSLFPIGLYGGNRRNIIEAANKSKIATVELCNRICPSCEKEVNSIKCQDCGSLTQYYLTCPICQRNLDQETCPVCKTQTVKYKRVTLNTKELVDKAIKDLGLNETPDLVKGVKGLTNENRSYESIEKGIIRAMNGLSMFKDGTIRFDATNAVLTHFKPVEIGLTIDKGRSLGYEFDINGLPIERSDQLCTLMMQDIIVSKECGEYLVKVANFIDILLERFYGLTPFYRVSSKEDLIGHLVMGLSPHTSVGVIGRLIGFTDAKVCFTHPFWHAAKRRDCDGDEDSVSILLDVLLNFSRSFLPEKIGGMMDAPILITLEIAPTEVARQAFNIEAVSTFSLDFFEASMSQEDPKNIMKTIDMVCHRLGSPLQLASIGSTQKINDINNGNHESAYKRLPSMIEKVDEQLKLAEAVKAVEAKEVARRVVSTHFMRDLTGNLRAFSVQKSRCKKCNTKYRRIPLSGKCLKCGGEISLTVFRGSIEKYLDIVKKIIKKYEIGLYHEQRINLIEHEINHLFNPKVKQSALADYM